MHTLLLIRAVAAAALFAARAIWLPESHPVLAALSIIASAAVLLDQDPVFWVADTSRLLEKVERLQADLQNGSPGIITTWRSCPSCRCTRRPSQTWIS